MYYRSHAANNYGFADDYKSYLNYEHEVRFLRAFYYFELVKRYQKTVGIFPFIERQSDTVLKIEVSIMNSVVVSTEYFELVKRYQNIPLITKTLTQEEANEAEPSDAVTILNFIISECTESG